MKTRVSKRDSFSFRLLIDEGLFFRRLIWHQQHFPSSSANLMLVAFPFMAVIEHDSVPFAEKLCGEKLTSEDWRLKRTRHLTKALSSSRIDFEKYSQRAHAVVSDLGKSMRTHVGFAAEILNRIQTDVGITYWQGTPVYSTYTAAHLLTEDAPAILGTNGGRYCSELGYNAGKSAALQYRLTDCFIQDKEQYSVEEYRTFSNDYRFSKLCWSLSYRIDDAVGVFFLLSELMMQLGAVSSLRDAGFFELSVWVKFQTIVLFHTHKSAEALSGYLRTQDDLATATEFSRDLDGILSRDEKRGVKRIRTVRNALIHYDFSEKNFPKLKESENPWALLEDAIARSTGCSLPEYIDFIDTVGEKYRQGIMRLLDFPAISSFLLA